MVHAVSAKLTFCLEVSLKLIQFTLKSNKKSSRSNVVSVKCYVALLVILNKRLIVQHLLHELTLVGFSALCVV